MLKTDGRYEIFTVEFRRGEETWKSAIGGVNIPSDKKYNLGVCPKLTGIEGTFDDDVARNIMLYLRNQYPECEFRVLKTTIWQDTECLWSLEKKSKYPIKE